MGAEREGRAVTSEVTIDARHIRAVEIREPAPGALIDTARIVQIAGGAPMPSRDLYPSDRIASWFIHRPRGGGDVRGKLGEFHIAKEPGYRRAFDIECKASKRLIALIFSDLDRDAFEVAVDRIVADYPACDAEHCECRADRGFGREQQPEILGILVAPDSHFAFQYLDLREAPFGHSTDRHRPFLRAVSSPHTIAEGGAPAQRPAGGEG